MDANTPPTTILDDTRAFLRRFVAFTSEDHELALALWVLHTHTFDAAYCTPYIYVASAEKQSGKTRTIETAALLAHNPQQASSVTASTLYRVIESQSPTLFIDEVDAIFYGSSNEDLRNILNSGYKQGGQVARTVPAGPDDETGGVRFFNTFSPKLLAGIDNGQVPDTIADRCLRLDLKRKKADQQVERLIYRKVQPDADALKKRIQDWAVDTMDKLMETEPNIIEELSDRAFEIAEPLLAIAMQFKGMMKPSREALTRLLVTRKAPDSPGVAVLRAAKELAEATGHDKIASGVLAEKLDMHPKRVGILLAKYDIEPRTVRFGSDTRKGYFVRDFADAWGRYL